MSSQSCYKILSIDGGGIKGLYSAVILEQFEEAYGPIHQHFNLICGTSTGGIIALALAAGIPASDVVSFYTDKGPNIFHYHLSSIRSWHHWKSILFLSKYPDRKLRAALDEVLGEKRIEDCLTNVLIPTVNITTGKPYIIKSDYLPRYTRDNKRLLTEVALATSAAPTYFPIAELDTADGRQQFVDGGLFANNPSLYGIQEFLANKREIGYEDYSLLSISSLHESTKFPTPIWRRKPFIGWKDRFVSLMIDSQSEAVHNHIQYLRSSVGGGYVRIPSVELSVADKGYIELDLACPRSLEIMKIKGRQMAAEWIAKEDVQMFFEDKAKEATA